ncbi:MAG: two-component regulator propeller domain-containing protein [Candidatus Eisenbacteria bacterium]
MIGARALATRAPRALQPSGARVLFACASLVTLVVAEPAWCLWQTFGLADGLAAIQVRAIAEDRSENMWFATAYGASRYDGAVFRSFTRADGLVDEDVRAILPDRSGRIWFGTAGGVSVFNGSDWRAFTTSDGLASNDVRAVLQDRAGRLWFATSFGASRFDGENWTAFNQSDGLAANQLSCLLEDRAGNMWFGTQGGGLSRFDGTAWTTYTTVTTAGGLGDNWIECILETRDGVLWFGTRYGGLSRFDGTSWSRITTAGSLTFSDVTGLREDRFGGLWAAASTGLARFDGLAWRAYTTAHGLAGSSVAALAIDGAGNVWAGTDNGVSRYDGESWTSFLDAGLGAYGSPAVFEDRTGIVWAATGGGGVARYDRSAWTSVTVGSTAGGLASDLVSAVLQDSAGALWFGTSAGASRYDGTSWRTFTTTDGLAGNNVGALARDSSGAVWLGTTTGLSRFDGATWKSYTTAGGLPANRIRSLHVDRTGDLWCGTTAGVGRLRDSTWTRYSTGDGLAGPGVYAILQDHAGALWFGTQAGLSRFDGAMWRTFATADGLGSDWVLSLAETPDSVLWVGTAGGGVSRFDGDLWRTYSSADGLPDGTVSAASVEHSGNLWFGTASGVALYEPARVPPQTVITTAPPALSANRLQITHFAAAYRQVLGIEFSTALDSAPWSGWLRDNAWIGREIPDGIHTLRVRTRDMLHHVDPTPASATFEVAATPPAPVITSPVFRQPVRDTLVVVGTASALRFRSLRVDLRPAGASSWEAPVATTLAQSLTPVTDGVLARLNTSALQDGNFELRLSVQDTLGLTGVTTVTFIVDNVAPSAIQTTPALVSALDGGDVYTTNREAHVYIPPRGLARDAVVHLDPLDPSAVPATLPDGAIRVAPGFAVGMEGVPLEKTAALDLAVTGDAAPPGTQLALYFSGDDGVWRRLGGTLDAAGTRLATPFSSAGNYAIFAASAGSATPGTSLALSLTPRIYSSRGALANSTVRIGFVLARSGTVRLTIHNRAGRLVRVVMSGATLAQGTNLVSWDGRDEDRQDVEAGLYLVTVEALGETRTQTLGVVR